MHFGTSVLLQNLDAAPAPGLKGRMHQQLREAREVLVGVLLGF